MMPTSLSVLRDFMLQRYDDLKARLTRRLGCPDLASDALQAVSYTHLIWARAGMASANGPRWAAR